MTQMQGIISFSSSYSHRSHVPSHQLGSDPTPASTKLSALANTYLCLAPSVSPLLSQSPRSCNPGGPEVPAGAAQRHGFSGRPPTRRHPELPQQSTVDGRSHEYIAICASRHVVRYLLGVSYFVLQRHHVDHGFWLALALLWALPRGMF